MAGKPGRAGCVNLIEGRLRDVFFFLNELSYGEDGAQGLSETKREWDRKRDKSWSPKPSEP